MITRTLDAVVFAEAAHRGQLRKYTGDPYIVHPLAVAHMVSHILDTDGVIIALLHDTVEDTPTTLEDIEFNFGPVVRMGVGLLTHVDPSLGNRAYRKALDRDRLADAPALVQTIKVADLIHNTPSIVRYDRKFATLFMQEQQALLDVLTKANPPLLATARAEVVRWNNLIEAGL